MVSVQNELYGDYLSIIGDEKMVMDRQSSISVTSRQVEVLTMLSRSTSCTLGEIASAFGVSYAAASKMIDRLESKGLVTRSINEMDRRATDVCLTQRGAEMLRLFGSHADKESSE